MFFGFNTALKGLRTSQRALYTTNHNINNQTTPGYSRQYIDQSATRAHHLPGIGYIGTGSQITDVKRMRNAFIDHKYWSEKAPLGEWSIKNSSLTELQNVMGEPSENSFRKYMDDFYTALDDLVENTADPAYRKPVVETAQAFTDHINDVFKRLDNMKSDTLYNLETKVKQVNQLGDQIAVLNKQIYTQELDGRHANDLRDKRELLVDQLSEIVDVNVTEAPDGKFDVSIAGTSLVHHFNSEKIVFDREELQKLEEGKDNADVTKVIRWENGSALRIKSGELKGLRDMLTGDGQDNAYRGIPYYMNYIDEFAKGFADKFNEQHEDGYDLNGKKGKKFFVYDDDNPAGSINVSKEILEDLNKIAAAADENGSADDNGNLHKLIKQREDREFFNKDGFPKGRPDDFIKAMMSSMAVDTQQSERFLGTQKLINKNLENNRASISGVSLNDEMANLVKYQKTYVASSKMINTLDTLMDITVNRLGLVGR